MDAPLRLSFDSGKASILTDLPIAVAAETVRITCPPIDRTQTIPLRGQTRQHRLDLGEELCSVLLGSAGAKTIGSLATGIINEDACGPGLGARHVPSRLITTIGVSLSVAA